MQTQHLRNKMIELLMLLGLMVGTWAASYDLTVWVFDITWGGDDE